MKHQIEFTYTDYSGDEEQEFTVYLPGKREICSTCDGDGHHSRHLGDVTEMIEEDEDFFEAYMAGQYDRVCEECKGGKIVVVVDWERAEASHPVETKRYAESLREDREYRALCEAERRMGC